MPEEEREEQIFRLEENADLHERISALESNTIRLSRRITSLEDANKGNFSDDPFGQIFSPTMIWAIVLLGLAPVVVEVIKQWKSSSLRSS